jgi:hypothetical protein
MPTSQWLAKPDPGLEGDVDARGGKHDNRQGRWTWSISPEIASIRRPFSNLADFKADSDHD